MTLKAIGINVQGDKLSFCALAKYHICNKIFIELQWLFYFNGNERWLQYLINSRKYFKVEFSSKHFWSLTSINKPKKSIMGDKW